MLKQYMTIIILFFIIHSKSYSQFYIPDSISAAYTPVNNQPHIKLIYKILADSVINHQNQNRIEHVFTVYTFVSNQDSLSVYYPKKRRQKVVGNTIICDTNYVCFDGYDPKHPNFYTYNVHNSDIDSNIEIKPYHSLLIEWTFSTYFKGKRNNDYRVNFEDWLVFGKDSASIHYQLKSFKSDRWPLSWSRAFSRMNYSFLFNPKKMRISKDTLILTDYFGVSKNIRTL